MVSVTLTSEPQKCAVLTGFSNESENTVKTRVDYQVFTLYLQVPKHLTMTQAFIMLQAGYSQQMSLAEYLIIYFLGVLILFLITRGVFLWYWKIDKIVGNQENQIKLIEEQNKLLRELTRSPDIDH